LPGHAVSHRLRGWPNRPAGFRLGRWGLPVNALAVLWSAGLIINMGWPRAGDSEETWYEQYAALLFTTLLLAVGGIYYGLVQRHKTGILADHRAAGPKTNHR